MNTLSPRDAQVVRNSAANAGPISTGPWPSLKTDGRQVREVDGFFVVSRPDTGALSLLTMIEMAVFELLEEGAPPETAARPFETAGQDPETAGRSLRYLVDRLVKDGWMRAARPEIRKAPLGTVYLTITRACNLACPYCYQGLRGRHDKTMSLDLIERLLDDVIRINDAAHIIVTGGEPLMHPDFIAVTEAISSRGLTQSILTNGVYLDDDVADHLQRLPGLERVQVSIDGMTEEIHAQSRGRSTFRKTVEAVERLARRDIPFLLNPTIHEGNANEIVPLARWAIALGGSISANDLRHLPHDMNPDLTLSAETLNRVRDDLARLLAEKSRSSEEIARRLVRLSTRSCSTDPHNARFICGVAHSVLDVDWNGDVYPCHMIKGDEVKLGNVFEHGFSDILARGVVKGWRTPSSKIDGCSSCSFVSTCAGGCRAKTFYAVGTPAARSPSCEQNGRRVVERLMVRRGGGRHD